MAQNAKNPSAMQETWVQFLVRDDPMEKRMGCPLQYSRLENSMDRGVWWATVHGVTRSETLIATNTHTHTHTHTPIVSCIQFHRAIFKHNLCTFSATYSFSQPFIILIPVQFPEISIFLIRGKNFCDIHNHICLAHYLCTIILTTYFPLTDTL